MIKPANRDGSDHPPQIPVFLSNLDLATPPVHIRAVYAFETRTPATIALEEAYPIHLRRTGYRHSQTPLCCRRNCMECFHQCMKPDRKGSPHRTSSHRRSVGIDGQRSSPTYLQPHRIHQSTGPKPQKKMFHFSARLLKQLKASASTHINAEQSHSTLESLSAHLSRCVSRARGLDGEELMKFKLAINGRDKLNPPLPKEFLGNVLCVACAETRVKELVEQPLKFAANLIHRTVRRLDDEYIRYAVEFLEFQEKKNLPPKSIMKAPIVHCPNLMMTSCLDLPIHD
eukprot:Gb_06973 [translate_table: standard]